MDAKLVWDGGRVVNIPEEMGSPRDDQMCGTVGENLSELSGRCCYDSLGRGRSSKDYHQHLLDVGHWSVYEHYNLTFGLTPKHGITAWLPVFLNRPGVYTRPLYEQNQIRFTLNLRSVLEWDRFTSGWPHGPEAKALGLLLRWIFQQIAPAVIKDRPSDAEAELMAGLLGDLSLFPPEDDHEKWISLYMVGSRGYSHEMVRHGDETAISQRSTRYVNEGESPWVIHPLIQAYHEQAGTTRIVSEGSIAGLIDHSREIYKDLVNKLETWLLSSGKLSGPYAQTTARKQARGAARGMLGNALQTELIFSASVAQWRHMIRMRAADAADAEIRLVFNKAVPALQSSAYGDRFADIELVPASDGLGLSLKGGGHK